jgi:ATP-binding cassette subfamily B protein
LIAFRIISGFVTQPLLRLSNIWQNIQELKVSFERLADIIDTPEESDDLDRANIPLPNVSGHVKFSNVSFSFQRGSDKIINDLSLEVPAGKFIGIVGQSGSGKSTLMKLLPRLYSPNEGSIYIDGYDIGKVELYSLRRQIGIVPQEPLLFSGSINENIALTDPDAASVDIVKAAKIADAHNFVMNLPNGYSSNVGERGAGLSGGQKQRIAIARTLLSKPRLLILDEATSALDGQTESALTDSLQLLHGRATIVVVAHRLSTIKSSDVVVYMDNGEIVAQGSFEEVRSQVPDFDNQAQLMGL